jgi:hypothetical protein
VPAFPAEELLLTLLAVGSGAGEACSGAREDPQPAASAAISTPATSADILAMAVR